MAAVLVIERLCEPSSALQIAETWDRRTALEDVLGVPSHLVHHARLDQRLDRLLPHQRALEEHLAPRDAELFGITHHLLLYDVTSTRWCTTARCDSAACPNPSLTRPRSSCDADSRFPSG
jgi:diadenosine tetraphosphatase ApaH/serine/threonine PP2A family protein phosphatase